MTEPFEKDILSPFPRCNGDNIMPMDSLLTRIDHVGIAVPNLDEAIAFYERVFGLALLHEEVNEKQGVREVMMGVGDSGSSIQLLAPLNEDSPIAKFLDRSGPGIQQVAYGVDDVEAVADALRERGVRVLYETAQVGTAGSLVNFCHPKDCGGVLIELVQSAPHHERVIGTTEHP